MVIIEGYGSGSSSDTDVEPINERIRKFITFEITPDILDMTSLMFGAIKEGIIEILDECLGAFRVEIVVGHFGA